MVAGSASALKAGLLADAERLEPALEGWGWAVKMRFFLAMKSGRVFTLLLIGTDWC